MESTDLVKQMHDDVARSADPAEASVRPAGTSRLQLRCTIRDVARKLRVNATTSVLDVGCGIGVLGVPLAQRASRYLGVDFAPTAVEVCRERLAAAGTSEHASAECVDILGGDAVPRLGAFDRVLLNAAIHFSRTDAEGQRFVSTVVENLAPGGLGMIGNVPLEDLRQDWPAALTDQGFLARLRSTAEWIASSGEPPVPLKPSWKLRYTLYSRALHALPGGSDFRTGELPEGYAIPLTTARVEGWLSASGVPCTFVWTLPHPASSLVTARADLLIRRAQ